MRHVHFAKIAGDYKKPWKPIKMAATVSKTGHVAEFVPVPVLLYKLYKPLVNLLLFSPVPTANWRSINFNRINAYWLLRLH